MKEIIKEAESTGKSFHGILASKIFDTEYEKVMVDKDSVGSLYAQAKTRVFAHIYGADDSAIERIFKGANNELH